jgi:predicted metal-dependent hydrolase
MDRALPDYRVRLSSRARHVNLTVNPIDGLVVVVPRGFDERLIPGLIHEQRAWIDARLDNLARLPVSETDWRRPESVSLPAVNENWMIEYYSNDSATARITAGKAGLLRITGTVDDGPVLRAALRRWLKRRAQQSLTPRVAELAAMHNFDFQRVTIRHQRSRWGSCSTRGTISLNAKLMLVAPELVDHVLLHELCHTLHPHHGPVFYELLASLEPDHNYKRAELRKTWINMPDWAIL